MSKKIKATEIEIQYKFLCPYCSWHVWVSNEKFLLNKSVKIFCDYCSRQFIPERPNTVENKAKDLEKEVRASLIDNGFEELEISDMFKVANIDNCESTEEILQRVFKFSKYAQ